MPRAFFLLPLAKSLIRRTLKPLMFPARITKLSRSPFPVLFLFFMTALAHTQTPTPVILSTDVGNEIDDQWAITWLLTDPGFDVRGIASAQAPSLPDPSANASFRILRTIVEQRLGLAVHPPLLEGASLPLTSLAAPQPSAAAHFIVEESRGFTPEHPLTVLVIGAATDAASALLLDPTVAQRIRIVAMAFRSLGPDGANEYNEQNDPRAWQVLLRSNVPITVGTADVCERTLAVHFDQAREMLANRGPVGAWLWTEYQEWYFRSVKPLRVADFSKPWIIWDVITLAYVRGLATATPQPRPELDASMNFRPGKPGATINLITTADTARIWQEFLRHVDRFQQTHRIAPPPE